MRDRRRPAAGRPPHRTFDAGSEAFVAHIARRVGTFPGYPLAQIPRRKRELVAAGVDVIDVGAGDPEEAPPAVAVEALTAALHDPAMSKYGFQLGLPAFREAVVRYHRRRFGTAFDPMTEVLPLIGSKEGLAHFALATTDPGDVVVVPEPGYQCYIGGAIASGGQARIAPLRPETDFLVELGELPREVLRRISLVYLNYPNNPTAAVAPRDYLERTVAVCREYGIALAYDNPYVEITFDGYRAPSIFEIEGAREVAVEFHSCSKTFTMTGWRLGWAVGNRELIAALTTIKSYHDTGPFLAVQQAAVAVLDQAETVAREAVRRFEARREVAVKALAAAGFEVAPPQATLYLWVPLPEGLKSAEFARLAMEEEGVIVMPGSGFGASGEGFFRVALTVGEERLAEAAERMGRVLARA
ncbi:MAG TPA: aminotransferase class I/II-fold pyridoxal phosphate-dependent enzyme [Gemmatimonadales bacterium]|nr:aminotransferase class I/II-fold pyridoxal phosphate-dependent enzyme [Gemmatimonadales bacterium]